MIFSGELRITLAVVNRAAMNMSEQVSLEKDVKSCGQEVVEHGYLVEVVLAF